MRAVALYGTLGALALTATAVAPATGAADPATPGAAARADGQTAEVRGVRTAVREAAAAGIDWHKCPPAGKEPVPSQCGTVRVPVDYAKPHGERISLTVSRARATGGKKRHQGPLLYNPGGPGGNGLRFPLYGSQLGGTWKRLQQSYDLVGYAPRGVGPSAPVSCQEPREFAKGPNRAPRRPSESYKRQMRERAAAYARGCARDQGARLAHFTTADHARDLHVIRAGLGARKLSYLGVSYGTYLGSVYATLFPGHVRRLALDSVVNPDRRKIWYQANLDQNTAFERRWHDWKRWVARHDDVYGLGTTPARVQRAFDTVRDAVDRNRDGADRPVGSRELLTGFLDVVYADHAWAGHAHALAEYRKGNRRPLLALAAPETGASAAAAAENSNAAYNAVECADAPWPRDWTRWDRDNAVLAAHAPLNTWENAWMNLPCAYWQGPQSRPVEVGTEPGALPPVLLLAASRDGATPYEGALETQRRLPGSSLVTERGAGSHGIAGGPNECVNRHLEAYLLHGRTPGRAADCAPRPEPQADRGARGAPGPDGARVTDRG
ncbi:alpha/beta hydrolase [Streptomyces armeniacus]|uniref:Alpha/beta hydrolase n=1 Tax=Streptomyces armeniacus TaxID=83291 RepID=A0A345XML3_9ACTN|nr:alpha/beta hydrolase [Streptomyces armeniacus]AXK32879.1 alpha/beta hydrolase [Streptomyces armeniacus]